MRAQFYTGLTGGVLEALGQLLAPEVRLYVFSMPAAVLRERLRTYGVEESFYTVARRDVLSIGDVKIAPPLGHLLDFLREAGWVVGVEE